MDARERDDSLSGSLHRLGADLGDLIRAELALFKSEMMGEARRVLQAAIGFGAAGLVGLLALGAMTAFLILVLSLAMPAWGAALVVTILYGATAAGLALAAKARLNSALPLDIDETKRSVKEDVAWIRSGIKFGNK